MKRFSVAGIGISLVAGSPVIAQTRVSGTGTLIPGRTASAPVSSIGQERIAPEERKEKDVDFGAALTSARLMAECTVKRRAVAVKAFLEAASPAIVSATMKALKPVETSCLSKTLSDSTSSKFSFGYRTYYDLWAEAYLRQFGMPKLEAVPIADLLSDEGFQKSPLLTQVATCLAYTQPARTEAVIYAPAESTQEQTAFAALAPYIGGCFDNKTTMTIKKATLRLRMASAIYLRGIAYPDDKNAVAIADRGQ